MHGPEHHRMTYYPSGVAGLSASGLSGNYYRPRRSGLSGVLSAIGDAAAGAVEQRIERAGKYLKIDAQKDLLDVLDSIEHCRPKVAAIDSVHWVEGVLDDHDQPMKSGSAGAVERVAKDLHDLAEERGLSEDQVKLRRKYIKTWKEGLERASQSGSRT